jgi:ferredoxin
VVVREPQPVEFRLRGHTRRVMAAPGQTVLDAGLSAGLSLPYSCTLGGCATCQVTLCEGEVWMEEPNCLTDEERARRQVLMCVSRPVSPVVVDVP